MTKALRLAYALDLQRSSWHPRYLCPQPNQNDHLRRSSTWHPSSASRPTREAKRKTTAYSFFWKPIQRACGSFFGGNLKVSQWKENQIIKWVQHKRYKRVNLTKRIGSSVKKWNGKQKMSLARWTPKWSLGSPRRWKRVALQIEVPYPPSIWVFPKIVGFPPKSSILIGFSIIFTIHFGVLYLSIFGNPHNYREKVPPSIEKKYREKYDEITMSAPNTPRENET